jgi:protoporphyrin/coproporphyrin ferrochelatase
LYGVVLPRRSKASAEKYKAVWTAEGSPLAFHTREQARLLAQRCGLQVEHAMRYGEPTIASALKKCSDEPVVLPLYPQYSESTTESVRDALPPGCRMVEHFHDHPGYIRALASGVRRHWQAHGRAPVLLMSFHGLPKRGGERYESECGATARLLAEELQLADAEWRLTFQSRFGYADWLQPYTEPTIVQLARDGMQRVDVVCPGFVCDCLETLEEIGIAARRAFHAAGGKTFHLLPCLNESPDWIDALADIARTKA